MKEEITTLDSLIKEGLIGPFLGAVLLKDKEEGADIGTILRVVVTATHKAYHAALETNVPFYIEENGNLYELNSSVGKRFIKRLQKPSRIFPNEFHLD